MPMNKDACVLSLFDYPAGKLLSRIEIECVDPVTKKARLIGPRSPSDSTTGFDELRREVKQRIAKLAGASPASKTSP